MTDTFLKAINEVGRERLNFNGPDVSDLTHCATLEIHKHYNGSGPDAFGGSKEWPHLSLDINLPDTYSAIAAEYFISDLRALLERHGFDYIGTIGSPL